METEYWIKWNKNHIKRKCGIDNKTSPIEHSSKDIALEY